MCQVNRSSITFLVRQAFAKQFEVMLVTFVLFELIIQNDRTFRHKDDAGRSRHARDI